MVCDRKYGVCFLEVKYERLVINPEDTLAEICAILDAPYDEQTLSHPSSATHGVPEQGLPWHRNSVKPPDLRKVGVWKHRLSRSDRLMFDQIAGDALELFGYEREVFPFDLGSKLKNLIDDGLRR